MTEHAAEPAAAPLAEPQPTAGAAAPAPRGRTVRNWVLGAVLVALVGLVYAPTLSNGFIWDDGQHVLNNPVLESGRGLIDIWFRWGAIPQYYPLVHTTFFIEHQLWGKDPRGYHAVNLALHALAALLAWRLLARLQVPGAWLAAALFAVHPVNVESVAWMSERKNVLSLVFALGSLLAYFRAAPPLAPADRGSPTAVVHWGFYALALGLFLCALFSKTVTASVPAVVLVVYWWKQGFIGWRQAAAVVPFFVCGASLAAITVWQERTVVGALGEEWSSTPVERVLIAGRVAWFYAGKLAWPHPLMFFYPRWTIDAGSWPQYAFPAAAAGLLLGLWAARRRIGRGPLAAALVFGGVLFPAMGFFNVFPFRYSFVADHFQYHASVALLALAAAVAATAGAAVRQRRPWLAALAASLLLAPLVVLAHRQTYVYRNVRTLWEDTLAKNPACWAAHANLGDYWLAQGRAETAVAMYREGLRYVPRPAEMQLRISLGHVLQDLAKPADAFIEYERALECAHPDQRWLAHLNLASVLQDLRRNVDALDHYRQAEQLHPGALDGPMQLNLGTCLLDLGRPAQAGKHYREALRLDAEPKWLVHFQIGQCLHLTGNLDEAITEYRRAWELNRGYLPIQSRLNEALGQRHAR